MTLNTDENFAPVGPRGPSATSSRATGSLIGEVFGSPEVLRRYVSDGGRPGLHLVFLFEFLAASYGADRYRAIIEQFERDFPAPMVPTYVLENHDRTRSLSRLGGDLRKARVMATLLCTLRGVPVLYQGQEIGMENRYIPLREANDPVPGVVARWIPEAVNRKLPERFNRDEVRTPMQWQTGPGAGFCPPEATAWLPIHANAGERNVAVEAADEASLLHWYRELLALRRSSEALQHGELVMAPASGDDVLRYERVLGDERVTVIANMSDAPRTAWVGASTELLASSDPGIVVTDHADRGRTEVLLAPHAAVVLAG
ncbi:MAG: alpha-amylase family glycosyl hydrolase [Acidimicrobiales bacterium]